MPTRSAQTSDRPTIHARRIPASYARLDRPSATFRRGRTISGAAATVARSSRRRAAAVWPGSSATITRTTTFVSIASTPQFPCPSLPNRLAHLLDGHMPLRLENADEVADVHGPGPDEDRPVRLHRE